MQHFALVAHEGIQRGALCSILLKWVGFLSAAAFRPMASEGHISSSDASYHSKHCLEEQLRVLQPVLSVEECVTNIFRKSKAVESLNTTRVPVISRGRSGKESIEKTAARHVQR